MERGRNLRNDRYLGRMVKGSLLLQNGLMNEKLLLQVEELSLLLLLLLDMEMGMAMELL